ncbi:MAG TPA: hypothetical protein VGE57_05135 [Solimonas sp.]
MNPEYQVVDTQLLHEALHRLDTLGPLASVVDDVVRETRSMLHLLPAEELIQLYENIKGHRFFGSDELSNEILSVAFELSPSKVTYIRAMERRDLAPAESEEMFRQAALTGHIASMVQWEILVARRLPLPIKQIFKVVVSSCIGAWAFLSFYNSRLNCRFWRYTDFTKRPIEILERKLIETAAHRKE